MPFITEENRIIYQQDGQTLAEITFPAFEEGVVNIDHTFVDPVLRGQGVAGQLMQHTADALRAKITEMGYVVEDTPQGPKVTRA